MPEKAQDNMEFSSIMFLKEGLAAVNPAEPSFFSDLNLEQIVNQMTVDKAAYELKPFFYTPASNIDTVRYRQEVFHDLEDNSLLEVMKTFAAKMVNIRRILAMIEQLSYLYDKEGWFLEACLEYCNAALALQQDLAQKPLKSRGFSSFHSWLYGYVNSNEFTQILVEARTIKADLSNVKYCILAKGTTVSVRRYESEVDYSEVVKRTFEKFKQGSAKSYLTRFSPSGGMNHIEARIVECVARLYPEIYNALDRFCTKHRNFQDPVLQTFDREMQFYISYLEYIDELKEVGLFFCSPEVSSQSKEIFASESFDLALAKKCVSNGSKVVCNDFSLQDPERIFIVSGPNQGGKTTFARMFGQLHYLASLGLPIPGKSAGLFFFDRLLTHFEREEEIRNLRGKLQDDLVRVHSILKQATPSSIVILNEIFTSTTLQDAIFLSRKVIEKITLLDSICVCVTFIDELSTLNEKTVSLVSTVVPENPAERTFKIMRKPADGLAYALSIAEKYHLTYAELKERIKK